MKEKKFHPYTPELIDLLDKGKLTRREFIRYATLLGMSVGVASQIAGLSRPKRALAVPIKRGGTLIVSSYGIKKIVHPAAISWTPVGNLLCQVAERLTFTDPNNITHPYLLENWEASEDVKIWTLNLRRGIKFNNGDELTADDVLFTFNEWLNKAVGSSMLGLVGLYLSPTGIEKVNKYQVKLHLNRPEIAVPEHLFHYPGVILDHRTFEGDFLKAPHGTGPHTLELYKAEEVCVLKRRNDYWQKGADGKPLPYLDGIKVINMGQEMTPQVAALQAGEIDLIDLASGSAVDAYLALKDDPRANVQAVASAGARPMTMRVDKKPWNDNRVRMALKLCQQREKMTNLAYMGQAVIGHDTHVHPKHPEYCPKPIPKYDPQRAKELLKQAGYPNGVDVLLTTGGFPDSVRMSEIMKEDAAPAGFRITIKTVTTSHFLEIWAECDLTFTNWTHRPLGTMVLNLGYACNEQGEPVKWNATKWYDEEFNKLLREANGTLDVEERRKLFCKIEDIQMTRGSIGLSCWKNNWLIGSKKVKGTKAHPAELLNLNEVWLDEKKA